MNTNLSNPPSLRVPLRLLHNNRLALATLKARTVRL